MSMKMKPLDFGQEKHTCTSERKGDWIIFKCSECDYVRKLNYKTSEMKVSGGSLTTFHSGFHVPVGIQPETLNMN